MLGDEAVGVIAKVGLGVEHFSVGDRVSILSSTSMISNGTHAEYTVVPVYAIIPAPEELDVKTALYQIKNELLNTFRNYATPAKLYSKQRGNRSWKNISILLAFLMP
jgi:hypothetical protein